MLLWKPEKDTEWILICDLSVRLFLYLLRNVGDFLCLTGLNWLFKIGWFFCRWRNRSCRCCCTTTGRNFRSWPRIRRDGRRWPTRWRPGSRPTSPWNFISITGSSSRTWTAAVPIGSHAVTILGRLISLRRLAQALEVSTHTHWFYYFFFFQIDKLLSLRFQLSVDMIRWVNDGRCFRVISSYHGSIMWICCGTKRFSNLKKNGSTRCFAITVTPVARPAL